MEYQILVHKNVSKFLDKHPELVPDFFQSFERIAQNPFQNNCDTKKLQGTKNHYRLRIGKYRFLYEIFETKILIFVYKADSRGSVYK